MKVNTFTTYVSTARLHKYYQHFLGDNSKALNLYRANLRLSQSFYPVLSILEIALRNALNDQLIAFFHDPEWILHQATGVFNNISLQTSNPSLRLQKTIVKTHKKLGTKYTPSKLVAELTFGFWTELFERTHYRLLSGEPIKIFPRIPPHLKRSNIYDRLSSIRLFRNRIYHYETICFRHGVYDISEAKKVYAELIEILAWFDDDLVTFIQNINVVENEMERIDIIALEKNGKNYVSEIFLALRFGARKLKLFLTKESFL